MIHEDLRPLPIYTFSVLANFLMQRKRGAKFLDWLGEKTHNSQASNDVDVKEQYIPSRESGRSIKVRIIRPKASKEPLPPMLYIHGGGHIMGSPDIFDAMFSKFVETRPCVIVAPTYRNGLTKPYPAAHNDCYDTLLWMRDHAEELGIDARKFMIVGHSAGGGLAASVTLRARDTGDVSIGFQMPIYPMIDDQQPHDPARYIRVAGWDSKTNLFGWATYLRDLHDRNEEIPAYAAPARNQDYSNFPPTITFVGTYDPFYQETVDYVEQLEEAGVDVAFKVYERCTHGHEQFAPDTPIGRDANAFLFDNYAQFYDRYMPG